MIVSDPHCNLSGSIGLCRDLVVFSMVSCDLVMENGNSLKLSGLPL